MSKLLTQCSLTFAASSVVLSLIGMFTTNWISACIPINSIVDIIADIYSSENKQLDINEVDPHSQKRLCVNAGLFHIDIKAYPFSVLLFLQEFDQVSWAVIILLGIGNLMIVFAIIDFFWFIQSFSKINNKNKLCFKIGFGLLLLGCAACAVGISTFTFDKIKMLHNSTLFSEKVLETLLIQIENLSSSKYADSHIHSDYAASREIDYYYSSDTNELVALAVFKHLDPVYGFSYCLVWFGVVSAIFSISLLKFVDFNVPSSTMRNLIKHKTVMNTAANHRLV